MHKVGITRQGSATNGYGTDWATPTELYNELDNEFHFTVDVCASDYNHKHTNYYTIETDGLKQDWSGDVCFMNPPYGKALNEWMKKAYTESLSGATVVCLVPSSTDLDWWHEYAVKGEIRWIRKRPRFINKDGKRVGPFTPTCIIVYRPPTLNT